MKPAFPFTPVVLACLLLTACGFTPLYEAGGSSQAMAGHLSAVEVGPIPARLGQVMRNRLLARLNRGTTAKYHLAVTLEEKREGYGTRPDAAVTQEELTLVARFTLTAIGEEAPVISDSFRLRTSYDLVQSDFATVTQREDSAQRLALELAERIHRRLALYFSNRSSLPEGS